MVDLIGMISKLARKVFTSFCRDSSSASISLPLPKSNESMSVSPLLLRPGISSNNDLADVVSFLSSSLGIRSNKDLMASIDSVVSSDVSCVAKLNLLKIFANVLGDSVVLAMELPVAKDSSLDVENGVVVDSVVVEVRNPRTGDKGRPLPPPRLKLKVGLCFLTLLLPLFLFLSNDGILISGNFAIGFKNG